MSNNRIPDDPLVGTDWDSRSPGEPAVHGLTISQFLKRLAIHQEPLMLSCPFAVPPGMTITIGGTNGRVKRTVTREEFLAWEQRLFPGEKTILVPQDQYFVEITVD